MYLTTCFEYNVEETVGWGKIPALPWILESLLERKKLLGIFKSDYFFSKRLAEIGIRENKELTSCCPTF